MKIVKLQAENIKALKVVEIQPDGALVEITGKNGQGKSSVLDAIWWALAGAKHIQAVPIREGENKARIRLDLGELVVERKFTAGGTTLTVENADGARYGSPQSMLDDLLGALTFDPLAFVNQKPADQFEALRETLGLDFSDLDQGISRTFESRAEVNREAKAASAAAESIIIEGEAPERLVDVDDLVGRIGQAANHNAETEARRERRAAAERRIEDDLNRARELQAQAAELEDAAARLRKQLDEAGALPDLIDVGDLQDQLNAAKAKNDAFAAWERKQTKHLEASELEKDSEALTAELETLRQSKTDMIAAAEMPVEGLGFGDGIVTLNDVPFDQASTAQQLRASVALAMAGNPKLKVIRIKEGSFLDEDNLALIAEMAEERDYQVWVERVDSSGKVGIVIHDGEVAAVNAERAA